MGSEGSSASGGEVEVATAALQIQSDGNSVKAVRFFGRGAAKQLPCAHHLEPEREMRCYANRSPFSVAHESGAVLVISDTKRLLRQRSCRHRVSQAGS